MAVLPHKPPHYSNTFVLIKIHLVECCDYRNFYPIVLLWCSIDVTDSEQLSYMCDVMYVCSISMMKPVRASTVGASFGSVRSSAHRVDNPHLAAIDLGDREAKTRWSFRVSVFVERIQPRHKIVSQLSYHCSDISITCSHLFNYQSFSHLPLPTHKNFQN